MASQALVGALGTVTIRVRGGDRPGEVRVVADGLAHYYIAFCEHAVPIGEHVLVINARGARQIDVEPWQEIGSHVVDAPSPTEGN